MNRRANNLCSNDIEDGLSNVNTDALTTVDRYPYYIDLHREIRELHTV